MALSGLRIGMNITIPKRKRALLPHYAGPDVDEIVGTKHRGGGGDSCPSKIFWKKFFFLKY